MAAAKRGLIPRAGYTYREGLLEDLQLWRALRRDDDTVRPIIHLFPFTKRIAESTIDVKLALSAPFSHLRNSDNDTHHRNVFLF